MRIGIIGSGTMGMGIAQVAAMAGHDVIIYDLNKAALDKAQAQLQLQINKLADKGKITASQAMEIMGSFYFYEELSICSDCELIIEAVIENPETKKRLFQEIESIVSKDCIIASNTSSLSITSLASGLKNPKRFLGLHFFNPVPLMALVEVIPALQTDPRTVVVATELMNAWGKITVQAKDTPGFIVNRIARPYYSEAIRIYEEGFADFATIDYAMTHVYNFKMGPFALMDLIGNDINYAVTKSVWESCYYEPRYKPSFTQRNYVNAGWLGKKSGRGYYNYHETIPQPDQADYELIQNIAWRILVMLINEAADALYFKIASKEDIETAMTKGVNYPKGLLQWADEIGIHHCVQTMDRLFNQYHEERYRCSVGLREVGRHDSSSI
jgi:3-hydroxybutyryl-CoA dehydrogenase